MYVSHFLIQLALLVLFVLSAYKAVSYAQRRTLIECLYHGSIAFLAFAWLLPGL